MTDGAHTREEELLKTRMLLEQFLAFLTNVRRYSMHTVRAYESDLNGFLDWCGLQGIAPLEATRRNMRSYLAYLNAAGYAEKTINRHMSSLRTFYAWIEREGEGSAAATTAMRSRKLSKHLPATMSDADVQRLIATCDVSNVEGLRDAAFLELLYASGARISEVAGISEADIDFAQGQVRLFGKRSKERIVPLYQKALDVLRTYIDQARPQLVAARKSGAPADRLFVSTRGNNMSAEALRKRFVAHKQLAGLDDTLTPHAVRHTFATELLSGGADLKAVQELLGHESLATTQIYTHLSVDRLKAATKQAHPRG